MTPPTSAAAIRDRAPHPTQLVVPIAARTTTRRSLPQLRRPARRALLIVHVVASVGWIGLAAAVAVGALAARSAATAGTAGAIYLVAEHLLLWLVLPAAIATAASGGVLALLTPWGLLTHRWIVVKLALTVAAAITTVRLLIPWAGDAVDAATQVGAVHPSAFRTARLAFVPVLHAGVLTLAAALSVCKPWGLTHRGERVRLRRRTARPGPRGLGQPGG